MEIVKIFELFIPAFVGGGASFLIFFKYRRRSESARVTSEEYNYLENIVRDSSKQTSELLAELQNMARQQVEIMKELNEIKDKYHSMRMLVKQMLNEYTGNETDAITALRDYVK